MKSIPITQKIIMSNIINPFKLALILLAGLFIFGAVRSVLYNTWHNLFYFTLYSPAYYLGFVLYFFFIQLLMIAIRIKRTIWTKGAFCGSVFMIFLGTYFLLIEYDYIKVLQKAPFYIWYLGIYFLLGVLFSLPYILDKEKYP